jgi:hypothetical protein
MRFGVVLRRFGMHISSPFGMRWPGFPAFSIVCFCGVIPRNAGFGLIADEKARG